MLQPVEPMTLILVITPFLPDALNNNVAGLFVTWLEKAFGEILPSLEW